jgi:hypothetical protein
MERLFAADCENDENSPCKLNTLHSRGSPNAVIQIKVLVEFTGIARSIGAITTKQYNELTNITAEITELLKKEIKMTTNFQMYKEITAIYNDNKELDYETINKVFDLESRTEIDLKNLREYIVCHTLMCGQDVLKAKLENNAKKEKLETARHKNRCNLMQILTEAIDSVLC